MLLASLLLALLQPTAGTVPPAAASRPAEPRTVAQDRLALCLAKARTDPATAISEASEWAGEANGSDASYPQQCLGLAYTALLRWEAAERAFLAARDAAELTDSFRRAQLGMMAANAALAEERAGVALVVLNQSARDAEATGDSGLRAMVEIDRARAQVLQGEEAAAETTLASARALDPQSPFAWLLSATLARRLGKLGEAQAFITTAATLAPAHLEIGLEAGVIAMLFGSEAAAVHSWNSVIALDPASEEAATARGYLAQLARTAPPVEPATEEEDADE